MSRLESMIRRLQAQRDGIDWAAREIADVAGAVIEVGLGNGRTYDHLRERLPGRRIWVLEREPNPHPACRPPAADLLVGEADAGFATLAAQSVRAALIHYDLGVGVPEQDLPLAASLAPSLAARLAPGGIVVANNALPGLDRVDGPSQIPADRYYFYRGACG